MDFKGERRSRETHESTSDPEARLYRKGKQQKAQLCYLCHVLSENRNGLVVDVELTQADGYAEREAALTMLEHSAQGRATVGADRAYDTRDFIWDLRAGGDAPCRPERTRPAQRDRRSAPAASCATSAGPATSSGSN